MKKYESKTHLSYPLKNVSLISIGRNLTFFLREKEAIIRIEPWNIKQYD